MAGVLMRIKEETPERHTQREQACEQIAGRQPSESQEERPQEKPNMQTS